MPPVASIVIRQAVRTDVDTLTRMILSLAQESENRILDRPTLQAGIQAVFDNPTLGTYWVLTHSDQCIGCTLITHEWSDWNNASYWWIQSLYIQSEFRGQGLFEQLLSTLEAEARKQGAAELRLYVERHNQRAIRVYERNGFDGQHYACMLKTISEFTEPLFSRPE